MSKVSALYYGSGVINKPSKFTGSWYLLVSYKASTSLAHE